MGSRKRKASEISQKVKFLTWYRSLDINDRIAFKSFFYHYGRSRFTLQEFFQYPYFWQLGPLAKKNAIADGYEWMHERPFYPRIK